MIVWIKTEDCGLIQLDNIARLDSTDQGVYAFFGVDAKDGSATIFGNQFLNKARKLNLSDKTIKILLHYAPVAIANINRTSRRVTTFIEHQDIIDILYYSILEHAADESMTSVINEISKMTTKKEQDQMNIQKIVRKKQLWKFWK